jgi:uncharacterized protein DUF6894
LQPEKMLPRYFLHIDELDTDPEGTELPDIEAARREAMLAAREMLAASILHGIEAVPTRIAITDEGGTVLGVVYIHDALPLALRDSLKT